MDTTYSLRVNAAKREADLIIYDVIGQDFWSGGGVTARTVIEDIGKLKDISTLNVRINSPGGIAFEGVTIYNTLKRQKFDVITHVDGMAASAASLIAMAGKRIVMSENAFIMIHNPYGMSMGAAEQLRKDADTLDDIKAQMVKAYADRTRSDAELIGQWMDEETWMDSAFAVEHGFADEVAPNVKIAASVDPRWKYRHAPQTLLTTPDVDGDVRQRLEGMRRRVLTARR